MGPKREAWRIEEEIAGEASLARDDQITK